MKNEKVIAIVQARMGSTRLPGKVLYDLEGKSIVERIVERVRKSKLIDEVVVATSISDDDLKVVSICSSRGIKVSCGSEGDVLDRFYQAARLYKPMHVVRITGDCPLIDPEVIDHIIKIHLDNGYDYTSNTLVETYPDGIDAEVIKFNVLQEAWEKAELLSEREHVTPYVKKNSSKYKLKSVEYEENLKDMRWTVDEQRDYEFVSKVYKKLLPINPDFGMSDVLQLLKEEPELQGLNNDIERNEGYRKSLEKDKPISVEP